MRSFESLIKDLDEKEGGTRIVFDIDKYKEVLKNPPKPMKVLNFRVLIYLCLSVPIDGKIPPPGKIARDLKIDIETVKESIADLKDYGVLRG